MTLSLRNNFFKAGIILAALSLGVAGIGGYFAFPAFPAAAESAAMRSQGIIQSFIESLAEPSSYIPFWVMLAASAYSLICITLIYFFFEKTQSPEILFIGLFVLSMLFEFSRLVIPLREIFAFPAVYLIAAFRTLIFGRYFGLFSLFAASVYASGLDAQKQHNVFIMMVLAALIIALNIPVDTLAWDSAFMIFSGYRSMFFMMETGIFLVTMLTFFISAYTRGSKSYILIGLYAFLAFAGRGILLNSDTWITFIPGILLLVLGTWLICARLHGEYLWL